MAAPFAQQPRPEAVDQHGAHPWVCPQAEHVAEAGHPDRPGRRGQQLGEGGRLVVGQRGGLVEAGAGQSACGRRHARGREVAADSVRANRSASPTASWPSASELTRSDRSSPVTLPV